MDVKDIKKLLDAVAADDINELVVETGDVKLTVRRGGGDGAIAPAASVEAAAPQPAAPPPTSDGAGSDGPPPAAQAAGEAPAEIAPSRLLEVQAPIVGTFYASPAPDADAYVKVGDHVEPGTVLCIIEAMKLMNEIEAEASGTVAEVLVRNEEPVEYGQVLFRIDPD